MTIEELRELLILTINRGTSTLSASAIDTAGTKAVIGVEDETSGTLFFLEIQEA
ncbi:hypothetical protein ACF1BE_18775 [Streptomyces sp. NPDC014991]|uniref:hypothetical protein n=1 Tax=Streptomyces sp. NPDC014991 TaxID=3364935 RepID=UPI0036F9A125